MSAEDIVFPSSDSFWEVEGYRPTVKRIEDGAQQCTELMKLVHERAEIEKEYAKRLKSWAKKWNDHFDKGPEYGTNKAVLKGSLDEAERLADVHLDIKDRLLGEVEAQIKDWKTDNYKKQMVGGCKEAKTFEEEFRKAQKPWSKRFAKVLKSKKEYHSACKLEKTATNQETNARNSSDMSADQVKKLQEKVEKCRKDVESSRERYKQSLSELNSYNAKYVEDMTEVFQQAQDFEMKRLCFYKKVLYDTVACLDLTQNKALPEIYAQLRHTIDQSNASHDLKWWAQFRGIDMLMNWPTFEENSTEFNSISRANTQSVVAGDNVKLTSLQTPGATPPGATANFSQHPSGYATGVSSSANANFSSSQNPFGDDDWEMYDNTSLPQITTRNGILVRALFDYEGQEDDELSFRVGDVFMKIKDRDDQGWCTGQKDGRVGLYPDNYVEPTGH